MYSYFKGKEPDRKKYEEQIKRLKLRRVAFRTMWLALEDFFKETSRRPALALRRSRKTEFNTGTQCLH
jgi:hypothetical protein